MHDTRLQPGVQTPAWIGIAIWPLIAAVVGLLTLNIATLTNDAVHSTGYSLLERTLGVALSAVLLGTFWLTAPFVRKGLKSMLQEQCARERDALHASNAILSGERDSVTKKHNELDERHRALSNEHAGLQGKHKKLEVDHAVLEGNHKKLTTDHDGLKAQSMKRAQVARATSQRIDRKLLPLAHEGSLSGFFHELRPSRVPP
ncbi:MAG: hypothetical protein IPK39_19020 [Sulfuritalea sp.]|nr:hypothetical protein [Sulfuritalea sp.]